MIEPSELFAMSPAALRADPNKANLLLREIHPGWIDINPNEQKRLIRSALEACLYTGHAALAPGDIAKIVIPLLRLIPRDPVPLEYQQALEELLSRPGIERSPILIDQLTSCGIRRTVAPNGDCAPSVPAPGATPTNLSLPKFFGDGDIEIPQVGSVPDEMPMEVLTSQWTQLRPMIPQTRRHDIDRWILRSSTLVRHKLDISYCDVLRGDDEFWESEETRDMTSTLPAPFSTALGNLQAACLNTRLRFLRPRLFLQHPETDVVAPLGSQRDLDEAREALLEEVSYPFLRSIRRLQHERRRGPAPRVSVLDDIEQYLQDVLRRFGMKLLFQAGEETLFDPATQLAAVDTEPGALVTVIEPGLVEMDTGRIRLQAKVTTSRAEIDSLDAEGESNE